MDDQFIVIMAGGRGERFWPESRLKRPKHLLPIVGKRPMLRQTLDRIGDTVPKQNIFIVTNVTQQRAIQEMCPDLPSENVVAEPVGRDTAPAVALSMLLVKRRNPQGVFMLLPSDHIIHDSEGFQQCLRKSFEVACSGELLVTIGIDPTHPATGYGYIHKGEEVTGFEGQHIFKVKRFVEKPNLEKATEYLASNQYYWNAGMFAWSVATIEAAFAKFNPALLEGVRQIEARLQGGETLGAVLSDIYPTLERISIDFSVMEKADNVATIESTFDWDDVGEWPAIERHGDKDPSGNFIAGLGMIEDAANNIVFNDGKRVTALLGVEDLIVVHTDDATLVCHRSKAQDIKKIVKTLSSNPETERFV